MPETDHTIKRLPNGEVRITCNGRTGTVSSEHLVPGKLAQLRHLPCPHPTPPNP
jgi:hypothetical protein